MVTEDAFAGASVALSPALFALFEQAVRATTDVSASVTISKADKSFFIIISPYSLNVTVK